MQFLDCKITLSFSNQKIKDRSETLINKGIYEVELKFIASLIKFNQSAAKLKCMKKFTLLFIVLTTVLSSYAQESLTESIVYNRLIARKTQTGYIEGTAWDNSHKYVNTVKIFGFYWI